MNVGTDILPLSLCSDTAPTTQRSSQAYEELRLAESLLCLVINFPTAHIFGAALGNAETQLCSKGISPSESQEHCLHHGPAGSGTGLLGFFVSPGFPRLHSQGRWDFTTVSKGT